MRLSIRWQLAFVSVALSLLPIVFVGVIAYRSAQGALEERIRFNLETLGSQTQEKVNRLLLDRQQNLRVWSQLGFIRDDTVTGDADGRVFQFLQEAKRNSDLTQEIWVANAAGTVIASTVPGMRGREVGDREWLQAARKGEAWVGQPSTQDLTGRVGMPFAFPLQASFDRAKVVGVIVETLDWPKVVDILHGVKVVPEGQDERGYLVLTDTRGVILVAPTFMTSWEAGKTPLGSLGLEGLDQVAATAASGSGTLAVRDAQYLVGFARTEKQSYLPSAWRSALLMRSDVAFAPLRGLLTTIFALSVILAVIAAGGSFYWANRFSRPIMSLVPFLRSVAGGDLSQGFSAERHDELGMLAEAANDMSAQLRRLIQELQQAASQITNASTQVLSAAEEHASGSVQQAASIAQVTATMEELTNTAKQIAMSATSVERIAEDSAQAAHAGYNSVGEALEAMEKIRRRVADISGKTLLLGERSQRISEVLNLIKDIAGEIHLLAVNAAIESAAAGEHGKRFAVVASEVRRLAERTRESAEEIKGIVGEIQSATNTSVLATEQGVKEVENGVSLATGARGSLEEIIQMVDRTTQAIRQITFATQQQQSASEQIVQTMREVAEVTRHAAAGMKQSANSVGELNLLADQFKTRIREFKL
jgi:methyl-accepting chemotaxis protein